VELRGAAERNVGKITLERDELRRRAEHAEEQLNMAHILRSPLSNGFIYIGNILGH
jgi:hypothetical protein